MQKDLFFTQLFDPETCTYTYLLADQKSKEALLIDTVLQNTEDYLALLAERRLQLKYILETHIHADHVTGAALLKEKTGAKTAVSSKAKVNCADLLLDHQDEIAFGDFKLKAIATPGHTDSCMSFYLPGMVFTGDSLMIDSAGRTDFQQGSAARLYQSITENLYTLPDETKVYPGHDYKGRPSSTIGEEKKSNQRINQGRSREEFVQIMNELKLSEPKKIKIAVPANLAGGKI
jgi:sulfur dioxygenase